jgi:DNA-directed RNA polymerase subunit RPC12/RpoP
MKQEIGSEGMGETGNASVSSRPIIPSHLPSFLLPCPHCGNRMVVKAVTPVPVDSGSESESSDLDDITYACVQCGTTLTRTVCA